MHASGETNERVAERRKIALDLGLEPALALPAVLLGGRARLPRPPLALAAIDDHLDVGLGGKLSGEVREEVRLLARHDEKVLGHNQFCN